jgi:hypothetical protein
VSGEHSFPCSRFVGDLTPTFRARFAHVASCRERCGRVGQGAGRAATLRVCGNVGDDPALFAKRDRPLFDGAAAKDDEPRVVVRH